MEVVVECLCGRKYSVDNATVEDFPCTECKRTLSAPTDALHKKLEGLRAAWRDSGENIKRKAAISEEIAAVQDAQALPLLALAAQSGVREAVNAALVGAARYEGPGHDLLYGWMKDGTLGVTRLVSAFKESNFAGGAAFLCDAIDAGKLKENQISEAAEFLGDSGSPRALSTVKALRRAYPSQAAILDRALARLAIVSGSATAVPEEAKNIPGRASQQVAPAKAGCLGVMLFVALALLSVFALSGCDEVSRKEFQGIIGTVGYPGITGCEVEIYEASRFAGLDSTQGRIAQTTTRAGGRFSVTLSNKHLGRPIIAVARPTTGATYLDFGAPGNPQVPFDGNRKPWVAVMRQWLGGEDTITISPASTLAFETLMHLPATEVGQGVQRFEAKTVHPINGGTAVSLGIGANVAEELPAPPRGAPFPALGVRDAENRQRSTAYTYTQLQLARAANAFVSATTALTDGALDFYEALFQDAQDGVLDGSYFGAALPFFTQAGAPSVVGLQIDGTSLMLDWLASQPLSAGDEAIAGSAQAGKFNPAVADIITGQQESTGALRPARIDSCDVANFPFSGNVTLTLRGAGLRHTDTFRIRSGDNAKASFDVTRESVGVDGEYLFTSASELRLRLPDFALTTKTVTGDLQVPASADWRDIDFEYISRLDPLDLKNFVSIIARDDAKLTNRTEILLLGVRLGRVDAANNLETTTFANNVRSAAVDPGALTPGIDDVYELRVQVANPGPDAINGVGLDLTTSVFLQNNFTRVADTFGGAAAGRAIIFESAAALVGKQVNLAPGASAELVYPFVFLDSAAPANLTLGTQVSFNAVLSGVSTGAGTPVVATNDVSGFSRTVSVAPVLPDSTAELAALPTPTVPASVTAGSTIDVEITLTAQPRVAGNLRDGEVEFVDLTITFNGETILLRLKDAAPLTPLTQGLTALRVIEQSGGGSAFPLVLTQVTPTRTIVLTLQTSTGITGTLNVTAQAQLRDTAGGARTTQTSGAAAVTVTP